MEAKVGKVEQAELPAKVSSGTKKQKEVLHAVSIATSANSVLNGWISSNTTKKRFNTMSSRTPGRDSLKDASLLK